MAVKFESQSKISEPQEVPGREITPQYVNRFHVVSDALHTRIIFGDAAVGLDATFHSVVVMSVSDALTLGKLLMEVVERTKTPSFRQGLSNPDAAS